MVIAQQDAKSNKHVAQRLNISMKCYLCGCPLNGQ